MTFPVNSALRHVYNESFIEEIYYSYAQKHEMNSVTKHISNYDMTVLCK